MNIRHSHSLLLVAALLNLASAAAFGSTQNKNWKDTLKANLESVYKPTLLGRGGLFSGGLSSRVVKEPGTVLVVLKPGILAGGGQYGVVRQSTVRNGALTRIFQQADDGQYILKSGDRMYVEKFDVNDDSIAFRLWTVDPVERVVRGTTISDHYTVQIKFEFDKATLPTSNVASLQKVIAEFLKTEAEATAPKTIALGQTLAEVEANLGKPTTIIDLGTKKTYVYANMRVIFTDGKVSDVQ